MRELHWDINAVIEPGQAERLIDGTSMQQITVILTDPPTDPEDPPIRRRPPAAVLLRPGEARELAFSLLELAESAERTSQR
jgi:hypothetical protein